MDYRSLFDKIQQNLERIDHSAKTLPVVLQHLVDDFRDDLGLVGGRIYERTGDSLRLKHSFPHVEVDSGFRVPLTYPPVVTLLRQGYVLLDRADPQRNAVVEGPLGMDTFAAILITGSPQRVLAFSLEDSADREHVVYVLNTIRHAVNLYMRREYLEDRVAQAREIQQRLLPIGPPVFEGFDLHGDSRMAEEVGGDLYDFIPVSDRILGIAVADSSGHGLPAALQGRDVIVGLRVGVQEHMRVTSTIEKLNKVIAHSALDTRFISLFYGEIEHNGTMVYCNAGHNPPLLWNGSEFVELSRGGLILGPNPEARYERGYVTMRAGDALLLYTDGIPEAMNASGEMFGIDRLRDLIRSRRWPGARELVEATFDAVQAFSQVDPPADDQTIVALVRTGDVYQNGVSGTV